MRTNITIDQQTISKADVDLKAGLIAKGYNVLRKSKSSVTMVLWGEKRSSEELAVEAAQQLAIATTRRLAEVSSVERIKKEVREEAKMKVSVANLWRNFNRRPCAHMNIKKNSFYFQTESGKKVRISDHECYHFQVESERTSYSRASEFEAPDFDFIITELESMTREEAVAHIKSTIN